MFETFPKISRISKTAVVTEKIDGTNAQIYIGTDWNDTTEGQIIHRWNDENDCATVMLAGSRNRWLGPGKEDNFAFWHWVNENKDELVKLGTGRHYGEWWGKGVGRGYGMDEKVFSLFNTARWHPGNPNMPSCCRVVPVVRVCTLDTVDVAMMSLKETGSLAAPGFMNPEGIVIYHERNLYKKTFDYDKGKWNHADNTQGTN